MTGLLGVVLCGGKSTRMGCDKAVLPHPDGRTFLQYSVDRLSGLCDEVVVVGGHRQVSGATTLSDKVADKGPAVGVLTAIEYASARQLKACLVTAVDLPRLTKKHLGELIDAHQSEPTTITCAASDRVQPLVAVYPVVLLSQIEELNQSQHRSLARWLDTVEHATHQMSSDALHNANRPEDLSPQ